MYVWNFEHRCASGVGAPPLDTQLPLEKMVLSNQKVDGGKAWVYFLIYINWYMYMLLVNIAVEMN